MHIAIITDAWEPQVNGVVRTLKTTIGELEKLGHKISVIEPSLFKTVPLPTYPEIRLALRPYPKVAKMLDELQPDAIHISVEGPLGWAARRYCLKNKLPFTTGFHTRFPEYVHARTGLPVSWCYWPLKRFHKQSSSVMVPSPSMRKTLIEQGFHQAKLWSRGVNLDKFKPTPANVYSEFEKPIFVYFGRVAVEKNIEAFLKLPLEGTKIVAGGGPQLEALKRRYPDTVFTGYLNEKDLVAHIANADVFVFPSRTETFGNVVTEALACGVPVAAYPVTGPKDIIENGVSGVLDEDLYKAATTALKIDRKACTKRAKQFSWQAATQQFFENLAPIDGQKLSQSA